MSSKSEQAMELFRQGYNCSQAVMAVFSEELGLDVNTAIRLASSFGGGMGRLKEVCGAVSGMFAVAGLKYGYSDPQNGQAKCEHYKLIQYLAQQFKDENQSIVCRELLELGKGPINPILGQGTNEHYKKKSCVELVGCATKIMEDYIKSQENNK